jgi:hypothetical protein
MLMRVVTCKQGLVQGRCDGAVEWGRGNSSLVHEIMYEWLNAPLSITFCGMERLHGSLLTPLSQY